MDASVPQAVLKTELILLLSLMVLHETLGRRNGPLLELIWHAESAQEWGRGKACIILVFCVNGNMGSCKGISKEPSNSDYYLGLQGE